ncbi:MAG: Hsp20/alpha crystallin family protein [Haloarculaceae archaeon]
MRDDRDDRDDPFDEFFEEIERMMNEMMGGNADFRIQQGGPSPSTGAGADGSGHDAHIDVHETDESVRVVADIPGVEKEEIDLRCDGEALTLRASGETREYEERISLPVAVDEHSASATYNNGILEVTFDPAEETSTSIDI